jgi:hypothetical protein
MRLPTYLRLLEIVRLDLDRNIWCLLPTFGELMSIFFHLELIFPRLFVHFDEI